jgi:hypothetical protein
LSAHAQVVWQGLPRLHKAYRNNYRNNYLPKFVDPHRIASQVNAYAWRSFRSGRAMQWPQLSALIGTRTWPIMNMYTTQLTGEPKVSAKTKDAIAALDKHEGLVNLRVVVLDSSHSMCNNTCGDSLCLLLQIGGWGGGVQPRNRFVSFRFVRACVRACVPACARSGCRVGIRLKRRGNPFPFT